MYVNSHLSESTILAYADPDSLQFSDIPAAQRFYCLDCYFEFVAVDGERCPSCSSDEVQKER